MVVKNGSNAGRYAWFVIDQKGALRINDWLASWLRLRGSPYTHSLDVRTHDVKGYVVSFFEHSGGPPWSGADPAVPSDGLRSVQHRHRQTMNRL